MYGRGVRCVCVEGDARVGSEPQVVKQTLGGGGDLNYFFHMPGGGKKA